MGSRTGGAYISKCFGSETDSIVYEYKVVIFYDVITQKGMNDNEKFIYCTGGELRETQRCIGEGTVYTADGSGFKLPSAYPDDTPGNADKTGDLGYAEAMGYISRRTIPAGRGEFKKTIAADGGDYERCHQRASLWKNFWRLPKKIWSRR